MSKLLLEYRRKKHKIVFDSHYEPHSDHIIHTYGTVNGKPFHHMWDTAGQKGKNIWLHGSDLERPEREAVHAKVQEIYSE